jgi:WG repeat protein
MQDHRAGRTLLIGLVLFNSAAAFGAGGKLGLGGKLFGGPRVHYRGDYHEGLARVNMVGYADKCFRWLYVDRKRKTVIGPIVAVHAGDFSEGLAAVTYYNEHNRPGSCTAVAQPTVGYIDKTGKIVIKPQFLYAHRFRDGMAEITQETKGPDGVESVWKSGYIDKTGKVVIPARFHGTRAFSEGLAHVQPKEKNISYVTHVITEEQARRRNSKTGSTFLRVSPGPQYSTKDVGKWGIIDKTGKYVVEPVLDQAGSQFKDGKSTATIDGKKVIIDKTGKVTPTKT